MIIFFPFATALRAPIHRWEEIYGHRGPGGTAVAAARAVTAGHQTSLMSATHQIWLTDELQSFAKTHAVNLQSNRLEPGYESYLYLPAVALAVHMEKKALTPPCTMPLKTMRACMRTLVGRIKISRDNG